MRMQPTAIKATFTGSSYEQLRTHRAPSGAKGKFDDAKRDSAAGSCNPAGRSVISAAPGLQRRRLRAAPFVLANTMASRRPSKTTKPRLTMHDWEVKHYVAAAVIILVVMGLFAYSWS
jgi:hypothetical protein